MKYTKAQLIDALVAEWIYLCHDDPDPDDQTPEEYREDLIEMSIEELILRNINRGRDILLMNGWRTWGQ